MLPSTYPPRKSAGSSAALFAKDDLPDKAGLVRVEISFTCQAAVFLDGRGGTPLGPPCHDDSILDCSVVGFMGHGDELRPQQPHSSHLLIWLAGGDGVCVAVVVMLPGEPGTAMGLKENPGAPGAHASNGSTLIIMPSLRISMDGKRMLT